MTPWWMTRAMRTSGAGRVWAWEMAMSGDPVADAAVDVGQLAVEGTVDGGDHRRMPLSGPQREAIAGPTTVWSWTMSKPATAS